MKIMPLQRRDFTPAGFPAHVIWWHGDAMQEWSTPADFPVLSLPEQVRALGAYVCSSARDAYLAVRLCWHHGLNCVQVEAYAETDRATRRWTGTLYSHHDTLSEAVEQARLWVHELHRWLNAGGTGTLTKGKQQGVSAAPRKPEAVQREITRLEGQMERMAQQVRAGHIGSKATIASRNARRDWTGDRLFHLRQELKAVTP